MLSSATPYARLHAEKEKRDDEETAKEGEEQHDTIVGLSLSLTIVLSGT